MILSRRDFFKALSIGALGTSIINPHLALANQNWFHQINRIKDHKNLSGKEKGHVPLIILPKNMQPNKIFEVEIKIGREPHIMQASHYIMSIEMYVDDVLFARTEFTSHSPQATTHFSCKVKEKSTIRVFANCNLHGIWEGKALVG
jgi:desulfoferrodoxin-like iron-binding protein